MAAGIRLETGKKHSAFISLRDEDKKDMPELARLLKKLGFTIYGTMGTVGAVEGAIAVPKIGEGRPDALELIESSTVTLVINSPRHGGAANTDGFRMRRASIISGIPCITNVSTAQELLKAMLELREKELDIRRVEEYAG